MNKWMKNDRSIDQSKLLLWVHKLFHASDKCTVVNDQMAFIRWFGDSVSSADFIHKLNMHNLNELLGQITDETEKPDVSARVIDQRPSTQWNSVFLKKTQRKVNWGQVHLPLSNRIHTLMHKSRKWLVFTTPPLFDAPEGNPLEFMDEDYPTKTRGMGLRTVKIES